MKKFLFFVTALCLLICIGGCGNDNKEDKHTHKFIATVISPTCIEGGYTHYVCRYCNYYYNDDFVPADTDEGHRYFDCVCTVCDDFLIDQAENTPTLQYEKCTDASGEYYEVTGITADCIYIKIPSTYEGLPVKKIRDKAFWNLLGVKHVVISDGIEIIGNGVFEACFNLVGITIPESVSSIGEDAFWDCHKLKSITLGSITKVNMCTFLGCINLENIVIPDTVTIIDVQAFQDCYNLASVTIPLSVKTIDLLAFDKAEKLQDIFYEGTKEQWKAIVKFTGINGDEDISWDAHTGDYTVHCTDGDIPKSEANLKD